MPTYLQSAVRRISSISIPFYDVAELGSSSHQMGLEARCVLGALVDATKAISKTSFCPNSFTGKASLSPIAWMNLTTISAFHVVEYLGCRGCELYIP